MPLVRDDHYQEREKYLKKKHIHELCGDDRRI